MSKTTHRQASLFDIRYVKIRLAVILIATALVVVKRHDQWLPAFIAIYQIVTLFLEYRKLKSR
jgi:hypothetical protein